MKITKRYLKQVIKEELNRLEEQRVLNQKELEDLNNLGKSLVPYLQGTNPGIKKSLQNQIYFILTKDHNYSDEASAILNDTARRKEYNASWEKLKNAMEGICNRYGWDYTDSGAWTQFTKPFQGDAQHGSGNFKRYLTFKKGKEFFQNISKISTLLKNINGQKTFGKVSFKIASIFLAGYQHKDSVVIHYKDDRDAKAVEQAVRDTDFALVDRASVGRTDTGRDTSEGSDSEVIANNILDAIVKQKDGFLKYLTQPLDSQGFKQGLSAIQSFIQAFMQRSPHRDQ